MGASVKCGLTIHAVTHSGQLKLPNSPSNIDMHVAITDCQYYVAIHYYTYLSISKTATPARSLVQESTIK